MKSNIDTDSLLKYPVLVGDIGGTNARFAILVDSYAEPKQFPIVLTADYESVDKAIQSIVLNHTSIQPRSAVLAIAGPVDGDEIDLTNCPWIVRPKQMIAALGLEEVTILNDFEAQAFAIVSLESKYLEKIGGEESKPNGTCVVLGPGTGLGVAGLIRTDQAWVPVSGEGGHIDFGPRSTRDYQIFPHLERIQGRISAEQLLCGRGIQNIYRAICQTDNVTPSFETSTEITSTALEKSSKEAIETLFLFVLYLGRLAGDFALTFMAQGGIYLAGGIVQGIIPALKDPSFREAFEDKAPHEAILKSIPIYVITHPLAALSGLSAYAHTPSRFGVPIKGRCWKI